MKLQKQLSSFPDGKLLCAKNGTNIKWYNSNNGTRSYISKKDKETAEKLATKMYISYLIDDLINENKVIDQQINYISGKRADKMLSEPKYFELLKTYLSSVSDSWSSQPYNKNERYPENLVHKSISGNILRSKSEAMIDTFLYQHNIPYRYECELKIGGIYLYPDFTIKHPYTGKIYYWEHFGLMGNPNYAHECCKKLQIYIDNGIIPTKNLITTYETKSSPLTVDEIKSVIEHYFVI